jgi:hypothetical protein
MKFKNRAVSVLWMILFCWSGIIHAFNTDNATKTIIYPSILYPGKVWTAASASENTSQRNNIWQNDENGSRYRPLDDETPQSPVRTQQGKCCVPQAASGYRGFGDDPHAANMPQYRSELRGDGGEIPLYRSEIEDNRNQADERYSHSIPRQRDRGADDFPPFTPRAWQSRGDRFYDHEFSQYMPPVWDLMDDSAFSNEYHLRLPLNPYNWTNPYIRNNYSSQDNVLSPLPSVQIPLKNAQVSPEISTPAFAIADDWIPAPDSALVDSEEFTTDYAAVPRRLPEEVAIRTPLKP